MDKIKILVLGAGGFLGTKITGVLSKNHNVKPYYRLKKPSMDIQDGKKVIRETVKIKPDVVLNCAGLTDVDLCETNKRLADNVNVESTRGIAKACNLAGAKLVHISTDYVFDGARGGYTEEDATNPINFYGETKLKSEKIISSDCENYIIARVSVLYGVNGDNTERGFVRHMYDSMVLGKNVNAFYDQYGTPTLTDDIAGALDALIQHDSTGIFHVAGPQKLTRYEMALAFADTFGFDRGLINKISMDTLHLPAKRPVDTSLTTDKITALGVRMRTFDEGVAIMKSMMARAKT